MTIINYRSMPIGEHGEASVAQHAELARSCHGRRDGGGDGQGWRRRRDLHLRFACTSMTPLCGGDASRPSRPVRHGQAGRPGHAAVADVIADWKQTPGAVGICMMLPREAGRAADDPGLDSILRAAAGSICRSHPVLGNLGGGTALINGIQHAVNHRPSGHPPARVPPPPRSPGPTCRRCWNWPGTRTQ